MTSGSEPISIQPQMTVSNVENIGIFRFLVPEKPLSNLQDGEWRCVYPGRLFPCKS